MLKINQHLTALRQNLTILGLPFSVTMKYYTQGHETAHIPYTLPTPTRLNCRVHIWKLIVETS